MSESTQTPSNFNDWVAAKAIVDKFEYGPETSRKTLGQSVHKVGTKIHNVDNFEVSFDNVLGFELKGFFVYCRICNSTRQKRIVLFNEPTDTAYVKDIIKDDQVTNE